MEIYVRNSPLDTADVALLVLGRFEGDEGLPAGLVPLDKAYGGALGALFDSDDFRAVARETRTLFRPAGATGPERLLLVGLGKAEGFDAERLRRMAGEAAVAARGLRAGAVAFALPFAGDLSPREQAGAIVEAATLALYRFDRYLSKAPEDYVPILRLALVCHDDTPDEEVGAGVALGRLAAECENLGRDLANTTGWDATPTWMADRAADLAREFGLKLTVLEKSDMEERGMGGILGVARGSAEAPKIAILEHNADRKDLPAVALVGKGITFDSGGLSIKPSEMMGLMKFDKCGACVVIATMRAVAALDLPLRVISIAPLAENMPSGTAYRPGDVLTCSNGKTIEVLNTDAEGRLILADALALATTYEPDAIVDLATLTGSCVVALGRHCAGLVATNDGLASALVAAGERTGQRVWRLPLFPEYRKQIKSDIADMTNLGGREAGAITAGSFLAEFVEEVPWAHLDIAGVSWWDSDRDYLRKGGTGFGVRLLIDFLRNFKRGD